MAKTKTAYVCAECGASALQWFGTCPSCAAVGTLSETAVEKGASHRYAAEATKAVTLEAVDAKELERIPSGQAELDRALGGGLVGGQVALLGGDPGIGKSTLLLQALHSVSSHLPALYVSGEESTQQIALRARRLALQTGAMRGSLRLLAETQLERILATLDSAKPRVAVIDSIQTLWSETLQSAPGSVAQVRECAAQLTRHAKRNGIALLLILSTHDKPVSGSCVLATIEGTRPLLVEIQALVDAAHAPNPRRLCVGLEQNRLAMLLAVLHRHAGIATWEQDVFVNAVGGVRIAEPAADLAVSLAVVSSLTDRPIAEKVAVFGEIGLAGEVRPAPRGQERLREAAKLGFGKIIIPRANQPKSKISGLEVLPVERVDQAVQLLRNL